MNRAEELRRAIRQGGMPPAGVVLYDTLVNRADWGTGIIPELHQPRSLKELAKWSGLSLRYIAHLLNLLEEYGWIKRERPGELRRGLSTSYRLTIGRARPQETREPLSDAERARRYRQRKRRTPAATRHETSAPMRHESSAPMDRHEQSAPIGQASRTIVHRSSVHSSVTKPQVNGTFEQLAVVGGGSKGAAILKKSCHFCPKPARRSCRTCADHWTLESQVPESPPPEVQEEDPLVAGFDRLPREERIEWMAKARAGRDPYTPTTEVLSIAARLWHDDGGF